MRFLSQCIGLPVRDPSGEPIGTIADLIVAIGDRYPPVTGLVARTDRRQIFLPWTSVEALDDAGARLRVRTIDITQVQPASSTRSCLRADLLDKQIVDIEGRKVIRVNDVRLDEVEGRLRVVAVDVGASGLVRRLGHRGPVPHDRPRPARGRPGALHRLGGRRPARQHDREHPPARPARPPGGAPPGRPRRHHRPAHAPRPPRRPRLARRRGAGRRRRGDGARHPGRGARGPRARARRRHPRGDEPRRRGRPRRRPVRPQPRRDPRPDGARRGRGGARPARVPRGLRGRPDDDRVRGRARDADGGRDDRPAARARARRRDDLLRLRGRRRRPPRRRAVAARPDRRPPGDADRGRDDRRAGRGPGPRAGRVASPRPSPTTTCSPCRSSTTRGGWSGS